ncbi:MAG: uracil-DNA glycosylase, partial [Candidatus Thorarchaeota archaeon]
MTTSIEFRSAPKDCKKCALYKNRKQVVYPDVLINSKDDFVTFVIGEAPGKNEDLKGKPFIGRSGMLLRDKLKKIPGKIIISNTVKCRPKNNRDPKKDEIEECYVFLKQELDYYKPDLVILVGRFAITRHLPQDVTKAGIQEINGKIFKNKIPIIHPASILYNPNNKNLWENAWKGIFNYISGLKGKDDKNIALIHPEDIKKK